MKHTDEERLAEVHMYLTNDEVRAEVHMPDVADDIVQDLRDELARLRRIEEAAQKVTRVARANRKLADKPAALLKPEKTGEAHSPHFRITLNPDHPDTPNRLAKLYKLGVQGSAVSFQEASR